MHSFLSGVIRYWMHRFLTMKRSDRNKVKTEPDQRHSVPDHAEADNHERHISGSINVRGEIETKRPPDLTLEHNTERKEDNAHEKKKSRAEIATLVVVAIYAGLTWWQGCSTKKAADAAQTAASTAKQALIDSRVNFAADQRPILWLTNQLGEPTPFNNPKDSTNGQIIWTWHFTNYGKTPPVEVRFRDYFKFGDGAPVPSYGQESQDVGAPTPTGKDDFASVISAPMKRSDMRELIASGKVGIIVVIQYSDLRGGSTKLAFAFGAPALVLLLTAKRGTTYTSPRT